MPTLTDRYRSGYEAGKNQTVGSAAAEVMFASMLRDDPGGLFKCGYDDAINSRGFNPPSTPTPKRSPTDGLIPKFSENPIGWFLGVAIVVEFWALWQLIKAPFQLIGALTRGEKPPALVIIKNVIVAGLVIGSLWLTHTSPQRVMGSLPNQNSVYAPRPQQPQTFQAPPSAPVSQPAAVISEHDAVFTGQPPAGSPLVLVSDRTGNQQNWLSQAQTGATQVTWDSPQPMEITAQANPQSNLTLYSSQILSGDVDVSFELNHRGFGRTNVGLWSNTNNAWAAIAILDTNDTNYLAFSVNGGPSTEYKYSGTPYMNKWTTIQIRIVGGTAFFVADGVQLESMPLAAPGGLRAAVSVGSVSWKSGANDTVFRSITIGGHPN